MAAIGVHTFTKASGSKRKGAFAYQRGGAVGSVGVPPDAVDL